MNECIMDNFCRPCRDLNWYITIDPALKPWAITDLVKAPNLRAASEAYHPTGSGAALGPSSQTIRR